MTILERKFPDYLDVMEAVKELQNYIGDMNIKYNELQDKYNKLVRTVVVISKEDFVQLKKKQR